MTNKQKRLMQAYAEFFHSCGLSFETAVFLVGDRMKKHGIPINQDNLQATFDVFND